MRPATTKKLEQAATPVLVTVLLGLATIYFDHRTQSAKNQAQAAEIKTDKGYETLAPLVRDLQEQVRILSAQVDLLRQVALAQDRVRVKFNNPAIRALLPKPPIEELEDTPLPDTEVAEPPPPSIP